MVRQAVVQEKRDSWDRRWREMEAFILGRRCTESWKFINSIRSDNNPKFQNISVKRWEDYYRTLLTEGREEFMEEEMLTEVKGGSVEISYETMEEAIERLSDRKASGPGGIKAEMLKNGTEKFTRMIASLINKFL